MVDPEVYESTIAGHPRGGAVRGRDQAELLDSSFGGLAYLSLRGTVPTPSQAEAVDACLCTLADHSVADAGNLVGRYVVSSGSGIRAALAASLLAPRRAQGDLAAIATALRDAASEPLDAVDPEAVAACTALRSDDPAAPRTATLARALRDRAEALGAWGPAGAVLDHVAATRGDDGPTAAAVAVAVLVDLGCDPVDVEGLGLLAHLLPALAHAADEVRSPRRLLLVDPARVAAAQALAQPTAVPDPQEPDA